VIRWPTDPDIAATGPGGVGGDAPVRHTQAMVPEPNDDPKPDDEPDDETDDEKDQEPDGESDDEREEEPEPGTLYFGEDGGRTALSC
jgi:hypothetical protein